MSCAPLNITLGSSPWTHRSSLPGQTPLDSFAVETRTTTPEQFDVFIREDVARWADVVKHAGVKLDDR